MALTVGELNAFITIEDREVDPALRRAEQAMRASGRRMGSDAERLGRQIGDDLGDGITRGARRAGDDAGNALGQGLTQSGEQGADTAVDGMGGRLEMLKGGALAVGAAAGAALMSALSDALEQGKITAKLGAQLGTTPAVAQRYGKVAGSLFKDAIVGDFQEGANTINAIASAGLFKPDATNAQIKSLAANAADLANAFDIDVSQAAQAAGSMLKNGLAKDGKQAFDLLAKGMTGLGPASEDLVDTFTEYGPVFKAAGISGQTALGLIKQAIQGGWTKDTDKIADAFKEFGIRGTEGSKAVQGAFQALGLDAKKTGDDIAAGGKRGEQAMDTVLDKLRELGPNSAEARQIVSTLFGGPGEDLGAALFALDVDKASAAMGGAKDSADNLGNAMRDNAATKILQFKRGLQQNVVEFIGGTLLPAFMKVRTSVGHLWDDAGKGGKEGADRVVAFFGLVAQRFSEKARELAPKAIAALSGVGQKVADYIMANPEKSLKIGAIAAAIVAAMIMLPLLVAAGIGVAASLMMVGFVKKMQSGLTENLPKWWNSFTAWVRQKASAAPGVFNVVGSAIGGWFGRLWSRYIAGPVSRQWNSFLSTVRGLPSRAVTALNPLGGRLSGVSSAAWQRFRTAAGTRVSSFLGWARGIPGQARSALGNLGSYLYNSGASLIQGFINGIRAKIGQVRNAAASVVSAARDYFPFSPAKKGPFSGRGYTLYSGRALIDAFGKGIADQAPSVQKRMHRLLDGMSGTVAGDVAVRPSMASLIDTPAPGYGSGRGGWLNVPKTRVQLEFRSSGRAMDNAIMSSVQRTVRKNAGPDVVFAFNGQRRG